MTTWWYKDKHDQEVWQVIDAYEFNIEIMSADKAFNLAKEKFYEIDNGDYDEIRADIEMMLCRALTSEEAADLKIWVEDKIFSANTEEK